MKNLHIPNPCSENWELMSPQEKGRFCSMCNKCVIDFTEKNSSEIKDIIENNFEKTICGRFYDHQLNITDEKSERMDAKILKYIPLTFQQNKITLGFLSFILFFIGCTKSKEKCVTTGEIVNVSEESPSNDNFVMGEPLVVKNDSVAKIPEKDSLHLKEKK